MEHKEQKEEFLRNFRYIRRIWEWTQEDLAKYLDTSVATIKRIDGFTNKKGVTTIQYFALRYWADGLIDLSGKRYTIMRVLLGDDIDEKYKKYLKHCIDEIGTNGEHLIVDRVYPFCEKVVNGDVEEINEYLKPKAEIEKLEKEL